MGHGMQGAELTGCEITKDERTIDLDISKQGRPYQGAGG